MDIRYGFLAMLLTLTGCGGGSSSSVIPSQTVKEPPLSNIVAFMGDSITQFWDLSLYDTTNPTVNFGIAGQTSVQMLARFGAVLSSGAGVVVIDAGINDLYWLGPQVTNLDSIASMAAQAHAAGMRVILTSLIPDSFAYTSGVAPVNGDILAMNDKLVALAQAQGYLYADYYDAMLLPDGTQDVAATLDGLHPNAIGYAKMWAVLQPLVDEQLH